MYWDFVLAATLYAWWTMIVHAHSHFSDLHDMAYYKRAGSAPPAAKTILVWDWHAVRRRYAWLRDFRADAGERAACERRPPGALALAACRVTGDRSLHDADAVVFLMSRARAPRLPARRSPRQRFVYFTLDAPPNAEVSPDTRNVFNWTMTYRLDSDVPFSLGEVVPRGPGPPRSEGWLRPPATPIGLAEVLDRSLQSGDDWDFFYWTSAPKNDRIVAWVFNECQSSSWRKKVVDQLATYITVDVFTSCGRFTQKVETIPENLIKKYKFYLVFEESFCRDYVSGEFFNVLNHYVVPVVLGGANYSALAPPLSYIDARDFRSLYHLAEYLKYLAGHRGEYSKFLWWKAYYSVETPSGLCRLCQKLHERHAPKTYADMAAWWNGPDFCNVSKPQFVDFETVTTP